MNITNEVVPLKSMLSGIRASYCYAVSLHDSCEVLYNNNKFQPSIPLAVLSIEESLKGIEMTDIMKTNSGLTSENIKNFRDHKYKIKKMIERSIKTLDEMPKKFFSELKLNQKEIIEKAEKDYELHKQYKNLKEICCFSEFDNIKKYWQTFSNMVEQKIELAYYFMMRAKYIVWLFENNLQRYVDKKLGISYKSSYHEYFIKQYFEDLNEEKYSIGEKTIELFRKKYSANK